VPKLSTASANRCHIIPGPKVVKFLNQCLVLLLPKRALSTAFSDSPLMLGCPFCLDLVASPFFGVGLEERFVKTFAEAIAHPLLQVFLWSMGHNFASSSIKGKLSTPPRLDRVLNKLRDN